MVSHGEKLVIMWGEIPPVHTVAYEKPMGEHDSGYTALFDDAPDPDELDEPNGGLPHGINVMCLHCFVDEHPEVGQAMDLARRFGQAVLDENDVWVGRPLEPAVD